MEIKVSAKIDPSDRPYFEEVIAPLLKHPLVTFVGEISDGEKDEFLGNAYALLFPIDWPEPFGLVMIEAMACGTPIVAYRHGSVPEIMEEGVTGFIVDGLDAAVQATDRIAGVSRKRCRRWFEQHFSATRMAEDYLAIYQSLIDRKPKLSYAV
jgi:glycosyltransferase involved in cell wall biosynthesis